MKLDKQKIENKFQRLHVITLHAEYYKTLQSEIKDEPNK
jgi:hypothetical protein